MLHVSALVSAWRARRRLDVSRPAAGPSAWGGRDAGRAKRAIRSRRRSDCFRSGIRSRAQAREPARADARRAQPRRAREPDDSGRAIRRHPARAGRVRARMGDGPDSRRAGADVLSTSTSFFQYFWTRHRGRTIAIIALLWLAALLDAVGFTTTLPLIDLLMRDAGEAGGRASAFVRILGSRPTLPALLAVIVAAFCAKALVRWLAMRRVADAVIAVSTELRTELTAALLSADWRFFVQTPAGHLATTASVDTMRAAYAYRRACVGVAAALQLIVYLTLIVFMSVWTAIISLVIGILALGVWKWLARPTREGGTQQALATRELSAGITDIARALKPARAMGRQSKLSHWLERANLALSAAERRQMYATENLQSAQEPIAVLAVALTLYFAFTLGDASPAALMLLGLLLYRALTQIKALQLEVHGVLWSESGFHAVQDQIRTARGMKESLGGPGSAPAPRERITLDDVSFGYTDERILQHVHLEIPVGSMVVITGATGAGKTTILDLLAGLYLPASGEVRVDGRALRTLNLHSWRRRIGYLTQEPALLHDTVLQNLTLGEDIPADTIAWALRTARADEFVSALPQQLATIVGEQGFRLSGGQRQRLALARALVGKPSVLLLDEPTANVDPETEQAIAEALAELKGGVTIVIASHRSVFERAADLVYPIARVP